MNQGIVLSEKRVGERVLPWWLALLLSTIGGLMMFGAFPPLDEDLLVWVGLLPLLSALWVGRKREGKKGFLFYFLNGWLFGLAYYGGSFWWINEVSTLGFIPLMMYLSLYPGLWAGVMGSILRPSFEQNPDYDHSLSVRKERWKAWAERDMLKSAGVLVVGASLWVCTEWLRGWVMTGFGWNPLGAALYNKLALAQFAEYVGVTSLSFIPAVANICFWCVGRRLGKMMINEGRRAVPWDFFALCVVLMLMFVWGSFLVSSHEGRSKENLPVLAIQKNMSQQYKWDRRNIMTIYRDMAQSTYEALMEVQTAPLVKSGETDTVEEAVLPAWVIWPESSLPLTTYLSAETLKSPRGVEPFNQGYLGEHGAIAQIRNESLADFVLITGEDEQWVDESANYEILECYNVIAAYTGDFETRMVYRKSHLVPFGEYIPFRKTFPFLEKAFQFSAGSAMGANFSIGDSREPLVLPFRPGSQKIVQMIPTVCFEDSVGRLVRQFARNEAQVIVNVTNDGWFNDSCANEQHWRNSVFRCIELRRSMIRAANTGVTMAIAPNGQVIDSLRGEDGSPFIDGYLFAELPIAYKGMTLYAMLGDWAVIACALMTIFGLWSVRRRSLPGK